MESAMGEAHDATLYDADLSFLNDLPAITVGEEPPASAYHVSDDFHQPTFGAEQLDDHEALLYGDVDLSLLGDGTQQPMPGAEQHTEASQYTKFEDWIPNFRRPSKPCDYCRSKGLDCYFAQGATDCNACLCLFRECSMNSTTMEAVNYASDNRGTLFDALHSVTEDIAIEQGSRTIVKYLNSKQGHRSGSTQEDAARAARGSRFPQTAVKTLRDWYTLHQDHPYPTEEEKAALEQHTGLKPGQIANWLANQRRKAKVMAKQQRPRRCSSPSAGLRSATPAIDIAPCERPWAEQGPLERWAHSPPENEPALMDDIVDAIKSSDLPNTDGASTPSSFGARHLKSSNGSGLSGRRGASSITSAGDTSHESSMSAPSSAVHSNGSSIGSFGSFSSSLAGKKDRRRRKRAMPARRGTREQPRTFQCTFCTDTFKSKYDWTRHEKSLHLSLEKYICAPNGPYEVDETSGDKTCVYCGEVNPAEGHEEVHNHRVCEDKGVDSRTFYRKDHLRQHLRLMHGCKLTASMDAWKFATTNINSRCGFCAQRFSQWQDRADHLTSHFRAGTRMIDWKGCRGFDPAVAALVSNAMPPYLIGIESCSPNPFSATNEASMREFEMIENSKGSADHDDLPPKATCWEILTIRLGKFANDMISKGVVITDDMLQSQARMIQFGNDDSWNNTAADSAEWLDLFKKAHGLDFIPSKIGGQGQQIPEDLELYSDLGVRIPFFVQLEQYNRTQNEAALQAGTGGRGREESETSMLMLSLYQQLLSEGVLHASHVLCPHLACSPNLGTCHLMTADQEIRRRQYRWCNDTVTPANAGVLAKFLGLAQAGVHIAPVDQLHAACDAVAPQRASKARAACLEALQWGEVACCPFRKDIKVLGDRRDAFLARQSSSGVGDSSGTSSRQTPNEVAADGTEYFPYHKSELPADRARQFATVTGPWEESGVMPALISTQAGFEAGELDMSMLDMIDDIAAFDTFSMEDVTTTGAAHAGMSAVDTSGLTGTVSADNFQQSLVDMQFDSVFDMNLDEEL